MEKNKLLSNKDVEERMFSIVQLNYQLRDISTIDPIIEIFESEEHLSFVYRLLEGVNLC